MPLLLPLSLGANSPMIWCIAFLWMSPQLAVKLRTKVLFRLYSNVGYSTDLQEIIHLPADGPYQWSLGGFQLGAFTNKAAEQSTSKFPHIRVWVSHSTELAGDRRGPPCTWWHLIGCARVTGQPPAVHAFHCLHPNHGLSWFLSAFVWLQGD